MLDLNEVKYTLRKNWPLKDLSNKKVIHQAIKAQRVLKIKTNLLLSKLVIVIREKP